MRELLILALIHFNETDHNYFITYPIINKAGLLKMTSKQSGWEMTLALIRDIL